jgi:UDP-GlcNAc:undecaprenyl-phosphate GlcNAc-1-phosphate transferase
LWTCYFGIEIEWLRLPYNHLWVLGALALPLTVFWFVLITNTINLIDGIDGLAAGITCIVGATLLVSGHLLNQTPVLLFMVALLGALLAFLRFNFNPARIFMGDSGSMVCGYLLAAASVLGVFKTTTTLALAVPILAMGLPLLDTLLAVGRRLHQGRSIFSADKQHIHHWLLHKGFSQRQVALTAYSVTTLLCLAALALLGFVKMTSL